MIKNTSAQSSVVLSRRHFLTLALVEAGILLTGVHRPVSAVGLFVVKNVTGLYDVSVAKIIRPTNTAEITQALRDWYGKVAIGGGRYSMGGQVASRGGLHLDLRAMNRLVWLNPQARCIRVQAGMSWRDLQNIIDPHDLSVETMQSYANFTVGGSVSVNAHGRYIHNGPICYSIRAMQIILANGNVVEANRHHHAALFSAVIGGYGAVGVISEVELDLAENVRIERIIKEVSLEQYCDYFEKTILPNEENILHNADLIPPLFNTPLAVTWRKTNKPLTVTERLTPTRASYAKEQNIIWALTEIPFAEKLQKRIVRPLMLDEDQPMVTWRNHEASLDVAQLEPRTRRISSYILQEYFVPLHNFSRFAKGLASVLQKYKVEALNVSIRYSKADHLSLLPWAKSDVYSFVLYYKQRTYRQAREEVGQWTRELIDIALANDGRYYLPYQLHATQAQFERTYPEARQFRQIKKQFDPTGKFSNELWEKYL